MTDKAGLQPPEQVMNAEALHKVGMRAGGLGTVSNPPGCLEKAEVKRLSLASVRPRGRGGRRWVGWPGA